MLNRTKISWCLCVRWVQSNWFPRKFIRLPSGEAVSCKFYLFKFHNRFHWREIQFTVCIPQYWWQPNTMPHLVWNDICNAWIANTKTYQQLHFNAFPQLKFPFYTFVTHFFRLIFFSMLFKLAFRGCQSELNTRRVHKEICALVHAGSSTFEIGTDL